MNSVEPVTVVTPAKVEIPETNNVVAEEMPRVLNPVIVALRATNSSNTRSF